MDAPEITTGIKTIDRAQRFENIEAKMRSGSAEDCTNEELEFFRKEVRGKPFADEYLRGFAQAAEDVLNKRKPRNST